MNATKVRRYLALAVLATAGLASLATQPSSYETVTASVERRSTVGDEPVEAELQVTVFRSVLYRSSGVDPSLTIEGLSPISPEYALAGVEVQLAGSGLTAHPWQSLPAQVPIRVEGCPYPCTLGYVVRFRQRAVSLGPVVLGWRAVATVAVPAGSDSQPAVSIQTNAIDEPDAVSRPALIGAGLGLLMMIIAGLHAAWFSRPARRWITFQTWASLVMLGSALVLLVGVVAQNMPTLIGAVVLLFAGSLALLEVRATGGTRRLPTLGGLVVVMGGAGVVLGSVTAQDLLRPHDVIIGSAGLTAGVASGAILFWPKVRRAAARLADSSRRSRIAFGFGVVLVTAMLVVGVIAPPGTSAFYGILGAGLLLALRTWLNGEGRVLPLVAGIATPIMLLLPLPIYVGSSLLANMWSGDDIRMSIWLTTLPAALIALASIVLAGLSLQVPSARPSRSP